MRTTDTAYKFLVIISKAHDVLVDSLLESQDVTFFENIFLMNVAYSLLSSSNELIPKPTPLIEPIIDPPSFEEDNNVVAPRRSKRQRVEKSVGDDFIVYLIDDTPTTIAEAYASPDADYWKDAVRSEMDDTIEKYKARLVAKGFTQKEDEDFFDTYPLVVRLTTIRVLLSLAASYKLLVH